MKKTMLLFIAILGVLAAAVPAGAANVVYTTKLGNTNDISTTSGAATTGNIMATGHCDRVFFGVYGKSTNNATGAQIYADALSSTTATKYQRSAALGIVGGKNSWYFREATAVANAPYSRFYLDYAAGFTGSVETWCTHSRQ